jgi:TonB family protein
MPSLFAHEYTRSDTRVARGVSGAISVGAQLALGIAVVSITTATAPRVTGTPLLPPRLVSAVFLAPPDVEIPVPTAPKAKAPDDVKLPAPAPEPPSPVAVRTFENEAVPTPAAPEVRPVVVAPPAAPPVQVPAPPTPSVGAFPTAATIARKPEPAQRAETAGFDVPVAHPTQSRLGQTAVGAFDTAPAQGPRESGAANQRSTAVIETGFNQSKAATPTHQSLVVRDGGFGTSSNPDRPAVQERPAPQPASFGDARVIEPARRAGVAQRAPAVVAVEVLSKPTPIYTDEARRLKIEGEVVLEVEFCASGAVRILRVVRGLGYGLDESALVAAQRIQFKPATSEGRPVDYRATVQIVFRLA